MEKLDKHTLVYYGGRPFRVEEVNGNLLTIKEVKPGYKVIKISIDNELLYIPKEKKVLEEVGENLFIHKSKSYLEDRNGT